MADDDYKRMKVIDLKTSNELGWLGERGPFGYAAVVSPRESVLCEFECPDGTKSYLAKDTSPNKRWLAEANSSYADWGMVGVPVVWNQDDHTLAMKDDPARKLYVRHEWGISWLCWTNHDDGNNPGIVKLEYEPIFAVDSEPLDLPVSVAPPVGKIICLRASNKELVRVMDFIPSGFGLRKLVAYSAGSSNDTSVMWYSQWKFEVVDAGNGHFALKALANNLYVTVDVAGDQELRALAEKIDLPQTFQWIDLGDGNIALKSLANNQHVSIHDATPGLPAPYPLWAGTRAEGVYLGAIFQCIILRDGEQPPYHPSQ